MRLTDLHHEVRIDTIPSFLTCQDRRSCALASTHTNLPNVLPATLAACEASIREAFFLGKAGRLTILPVRPRTCRFPFVEFGNCCFLVEFEPEEIRALVESVEITANLQQFRRRLLQWIRLCGSLVESRRMFLTAFLPILYRNIFPLKMTPHLWNVVHPIMTELSRWIPALYKKDAPMVEGIILYMLIRWPIEELGTILGAFLRYKHKRHYDDSPSRKGPFVNIVPSLVSNVVSPRGEKEEWVDRLIAVFRMYPGSPIVRRLAQQVAVDADPDRVVRLHRCMLRPVKKNE